MSNYIAPFNVGVVTYPYDRFTDCSIVSCPTGEKINENVIKTERFPVKNAF